MDDFTIVQRNSLSDSEKDALLDLWNSEYPAQLGYSTLDDFKSYLKNLDNLTHHLMMDAKGVIQGWCFCFTRDHERWFGLMVDKDQGGKGLGTKMLNAAKTNESILSGWVVDHDQDQKRDGRPYKTPLGFYTKNGFKVLNDQRLELPIISAVKIVWKK